MKGHVNTKNGEISIENQVIKSVRKHSVFTHECFSNSVFFTHLFLTLSFPLIHSSGNF